MSSFGGCMREYADVSLDRFDGENLRSTAYFLSHKHEDHMVGLSSNSFIYRLQSNSHIKLYCSEVTRDLLLADARFTGLSKSLVVHELEVPSIITVPDPETGKEKYGVTVTLIPAGHCPGSVMFLFEGPEGTALYTGDFRIARGDISRMECLRSGDSAKPINSLYIDTTFCVPGCYFIPSREECTEALIQVIAHWTAQSKHHLVLINHKAGLGYEHLFIELANHFNTKIHLSKRKFNQVKRVKCFSDFGTCDGKSTQIHACKWNEEITDASAERVTLPCCHNFGKDTSRLQVKKITVSTMWFTHHIGMDEIVVRPNKKFPNYMRACYSFHSSYSEVRDVVTYLHPHRVFPNVIPKGHTLKKIQDRLNNFLKLERSSRPPSTPSKPRLLGKQRPPLKRPLNITNSQSTDSDLLFDDSPVKAKKHKSNNNGEAEKPDSLALRLSSSQSQNSDGAGAKDDDTHSSYVGSQRSTGSAMDLVGSDFDATPKKKRRKAEDDNKPNDDQPDGESAPTVFTNGYHSGGELFTDGEEEQEEEEDAEVLSARENFQPYKDGSYGSHVAYVSDTDFSDEEEEYEIVEEEADPSMEIKHGNGHVSKCQNDVREGNGDGITVAEPASTPKRASLGVVNANGEDSGAAADNSVKHQLEQSAESSDKSILIEELQEQPAEKGTADKDKESEDVRLSQQTTEEEEMVEEEEEDVIMLDSEEGEVAGEVPNVQSDGEDEDDGAPDEATATAANSNNNNREPDVIDLTADDEDDDIVSMGVIHHPRDEGDGYHGDSESEENDSDGIMTDSDGSFAKASYEKTKTRMRNGRSRRSQVVNGFSSSDSESDSDATVDDTAPTQTRYPIAGSLHYSKTRLNGFQQTLVDTEVIVLDDHDDDQPPPNVTVVDIADKDREVERSRSNLASAEDLVTGAMEMASAATSATNAASRGASAIRHKHKPVLASSASPSSPGTSSYNSRADVIRQTARKSTSTMSKVSIRKSLQGKTKGHRSELLASTSTATSAAAEPVLDDADQHSDDNVGNDNLRSETADQKKDIDQAARQEFGSGANNTKSDSGKTNDADILGNLLEEEEGEEEEDTIEDSQLR